MDTQVDTQQTDFLARELGPSIVGLRPQTDAAREWAGSLLTSAVVIGGDCLIDQRYYDAIAEGILEDGLTIGAVQRQADAAAQEGLGDGS